MVNKKRPIDAMQTVTKISGKVTPLIHTGASSVQVYNEILQVIAEATTVDAVEVVHGHWFLLDECANAGVYCSVCHKKVYKEDYAWCNRKKQIAFKLLPQLRCKDGW